MENKKDFRETYDKKNGLTNKTYKLSKELTENFKKSCTDKGESQAQVLTRLMKKYIENK